MEELGLQDLPKPTRAHRTAKSARSAISRAVKSAVKWPVISALARRWGRWFARRLGHGCPSHASRNGHRRNTND
jgi:hypothetical protein